MKNIPHHQGPDQQQHQHQQNAMDYTHSTYCQICDLNFPTIQQKNEHLNSNQHLSMQVLRLKELERQQQQHNIQQQQQHHHQNVNNSLQHQQQQHHQQHQQVHLKPNGPVDPMKQKLSSKPMLELTNKPSDKYANHVTECCLLAHRDYFEIDAYHGKIMERSVAASNELKAIKLKQSAIKLDNRKSNQTLKTLKSEIDKKQTFITELNKNILACNDQFGMFKRLIQICSDINNNNNNNNSNSNNNNNTNGVAVGANVTQQGQQNPVVPGQTQQLQQINPSQPFQQPQQTVVQNNGPNAGTVYFINQTNDNGTNPNAANITNNNITASITNVNLQTQPSQQQQYHSQQLQPQQQQYNNQFQVQQPLQYISYGNQQQQSNQVVVQYQQQPQTDQPQQYMQPPANEQFNYVLQNGQIMQQQHVISPSKQPVTIQPLQQFNLVAAVPTENGNNINETLCSTSALASSSSSSSSNPQPN